MIHPGIGIGYRYR